MTDEFNSYQATNAQVLVNKDYYNYMIRAIENARHRLWISMFIANVAPYSDRYLMVRRLIHGLEYAAWRNVDVKVMLGLSNKSRLWVGNATTASYLSILGIKTREYNTEHRSSSHSKLAIIDFDTIVAGSHNWSADSLAGIHNEISLALVSEDANVALEQDFLKNWEESEDHKNAS